MRCPVCGHTASRVIDSRPVEEGSAIRRRRVCEECQARFTTYERVLPVRTVRKRDGRLEAFDPDKLRRGVEAALADRPVPAAAIDDLVDSVESALPSGQVQSDLIGRLVLERLRLLDEVASVRFASVYKEFQGADDFARELAELDGIVSPPE
jgi:transcriptional repressor NrdR